MAIFNCYYIYAYISRFIQSESCISRRHYLSYKIFAMKHENASVFISKLTVSGPSYFVASLFEHPVAIIVRDNLIS